MPWCPQCGAEYREGVTQCAKCGVALTDEAPAPKTTPWRERIPPRLRRIVDDFTRAPRYTAEAWRVLRRHPVLLVLPVAVAVFNAVERGTASYVTFRYTAAGREVMAHVSPGLTPGATELRLRPRDLFPMGTAVDRFAYPVPAAFPQGTLQMVALVATRHARDRLIPLVGWMLNLLVALPLAALVLAGYYGVVGKAVAEDVVSWPPFWAYVRRYVLRFYLFAVLLTAVTAGSAEIVFRLSAAAAVYRAVTLIAGVVAFALALTLVAIVAGDTTLRRALRSGAAVVVCGLPVALFFLAVWIVVLALSALLSYFAAVAMRAVLPPVDVTALQVYLIPKTAAVDALLAAVGTWLLVASFLWYGDRGPVAVPRPAAPETVTDG